MSTAAVVLICVGIFLYAELAIGFGYYMYLKSSKVINDDKTQKNQIVKYSIIAGVAFPVTFAIIIANKLAERS